MRKSCRFEIRIKEGKYFQCAVHDGYNGWAYIWSDSGFRNPCSGCTFFTPGKPLKVKQEVSSKDWGKIAGGRIRARDWKKFCQEEITI